MLCIFYVIYARVFLYWCTFLCFVDEVLLNFGQDCCIVLVLMSPFINKRLQAHGLRHSFEVTALYVFQKCSWKNFKTFNVNTHAYH